MARYRGKARGEKIHQVDGFDALDDEVHAVWLRRKLFLEVLELRGASTAERMKMLLDSGVSVFVCSLLRLKDGLNSRCVLRV